MIRRRLFAFVAIVTVALSGARAQRPAVDAGSIFRVFLTNGQALVSYGEAAVAGDRVVFTLLVGTTANGSALQLMSLPAATVDLDRTRRYATSIRAAHYAATRGEVDYAAMTQEVQRALAELTAISDPKRRLELAVEARRRLLDWSAGTYGYRGDEVRELAALFDEVIGELQAAAGERQFALDLRAQTIPETEPLLPVPDLAESLRLALEAARAADSTADRLVVLRAAAALAGESSAAIGVREAVERELDLEARAGPAYEAMATEMRATGAAARKRGDEAGVAAAIASVRARDRELGGRRPRIVDALLAELEAMLGEIKTYHEALAHYADVRRSLLDYEKAVRPMMSGFDGLVPVFNAVRDIRYTAFERLERAGVRLKAFLTSMEEVTPPTDLADVHATIISAMRMADHACARRRLAVAIESKTIAEEASSAAAGAMLLAGQAREQLVARLYPPRLK